MKQINNRSYYLDLYSNFFRQLCVLKIYLLWLLLIRFSNTQEKWLLLAAGFHRQLVKAIATGLIPSFYKVVISATDGNISGINYLFWRLSLRLLWPTVLDI